jgi:hypothetical protein
MKGKPPSFARSRVFPRGTQHRAKSNPKEDHVLRRLERTRPIWAAAQYPIILENGAYFARADDTRSRGIQPTIAASIGDRR